MSPIDLSISQSTEIVISASKRFNTELMPSDRTSLLNFQAYEQESCGSVDGSPGCLRGTEFSGRRSSFYLFILSLNVAGLQATWATEMSNGSPYLLSLGISKSVLAITWLAGPLTGILVQPLIGSWSDRVVNCPWGRRKPFLLGGMIATVISLLNLAWTPEIVDGFSALLGMNAESNSKRVLGIFFAVAWIYILDTAVNTVQAAARAFIVDCAPSFQQGEANAWAARMIALVNIFTFLLGYLDLPTTLPFLGNTQIKALSAISAMSLLLTVTISTLYIKEPRPEYDQVSQIPSVGIVALLRDTLTSAMKLPPETRNVCQVQFFIWIAWFPFLFYSTTYVGQLSINPILEQNPDLSREEVDKAWARATRIGTFSLLVFAITSFISSMVLPALVISDDEVRDPPEQTSWLGSFHKSLSNPRRLRLDIHLAWLLAHVLFAICMVSTFFIYSPTAATVMIGFIGISWSLTLWAPFAIIAAEIRNVKSGQFTDTVPTTEEHTDRALESSRPQDIDDINDKAGIVLAMNNIAVSAPQILATLISSVIFYLAQRDRGVAGDESVAWVLRFSSIPALLAAWMTYRKKPERRSREEIQTQ